MLSKDVFTKTLVSCQKIHEVIKNQERLFDFNMDNGPLVTAFDTLMDMLVHQCEPVANFDVMPVIYDFAFSDGWGSNAKSYYIGDNEYIVNNAESLWNYLNEKNKLECKGETN